MARDKSPGERTPGSTSSGRQPPSASASGIAQPSPAGGMSLASPLDVTQPPAVTSMRDPRPRSAPGGVAATSVVHPGAGLRLRLWIGFLLGGIAGAGAVVGLLAWLSPADPLFNPATLGIWPWSAALLCLVLAVGFGLWLDHGIASHLRGLCRAIAGGDPTELGALPASTGWGELSLLTAQLQSLLVRQRELEHAALDLEELRHRIRSLRVAVEMRPPGQRAEPLRMLEGPLGPLVDTLNRHWAGEVQVGDEGREDALGLRRELTLALADARESAEQTERGFVEATALLTTVRELQRLGGELHQELSASAETAAAGSEAPLAQVPPLAEAHRRYREAAVAAIEEMVSASNDSVGHLAAGMVHVQEIGGPVQVLANRATLIALNVALAGPEAAGSRPGGLAQELKNLVSEVRAVTDRTAERLGAIDREVAAAVERMSGLRERVAARLEEAPPVPEADLTPPPYVPPSAAALRLLERVREMVQDTAAKGERLSATGERASRAAERLVRRLQEEASTLEGLALRLGADESVLREGGILSGAAGAPPASEARPADLRLLGPDDPKPGHEDAGDADAEERR